MDWKKKLLNFSLIAAVLYGLLAVRQVVYMLSVLVGFPMALLINYTGLSIPLWFLVYALLAVSVFLERMDGLTVVSFSGAVVLALLALIFSDSDRFMAGLSLAVHSLMLFIVVTAGMGYLPRCRGFAGKIWYLPAALEGVYWFVAALIYPEATGLRIESPVYLLRAAALLFTGLWAAGFDMKEKTTGAPCGGGTEAERHGCDREQ